MSNPSNTKASCKGAGVGNIGASYEICTFDWVSMSQENVNILAFK